MASTRHADRRIGVVEIETQPQAVFHRARDWGELLITRQLSEPLFHEMPSREISTNIFKKVQRLDTDSWKLEISARAQWSDGKRITARHICGSLSAASRSVGPGALSMAFIERLKICGPYCMEIRTRLPVGDVRRMLTSPALGPAVSDHGSSGKFWLTRDRRQDCVLLVRTGNGPSIAATTFPSHRELAETASVDGLDATSILTGGLVQHRTSKVPYTRSSGDLDIIVALQAPTLAPKGFTRLLSSTMSRAEVASAIPQVFRPLTGMTEIWLDQRRADGEFSGRREGTIDRRCTEWPLLYTNFYPNRLMADLLAAQVHSELGLKLRPTVVSYDEYLRLHSSASAFRLLLIIPPWTHPVAPMASSYLGRGSNGRSSESFRKLFHRSLAAETVSEALRHAIHAEEILSGLGTNLIPFGQLRADLVHRGPAVWIPPSGWLDFTNLQISGSVAGEDTG